MDRKLLTQQCVNTECVKTTMYLRYLLYMKFTKTQACVNKTHCKLKNVLKQQCVFDIFCVINYGFVLTFIQMLYYDNIATWFVKGAYLKSIRLYCRNFNNVINNVIKINNYNFK